MGHAVRSSAGSGLRGRSQGPGGVFRCVQNRVQRWHGAGQNRPGSLPYIQAKSAQKNGPAALAPLAAALAYELNTHTGYRPQVDLAHATL
jgi:hypothetical protein